MANALGNFTGTNSGLGILPGSAADQLLGQVNDETDEERKKRLRMQQQWSLGGNNSGAGSALNSLAATNLFGGSGAYGR